MAQIQSTISPKLRLGQRQKKICTIKQRFSGKKINQKSNKDITGVLTRCSSPTQGNNVYYARKQSIM